MNVSALQRTAALFGFASGESYLRHVDPFAFIGQDHIDKMKCVRAEMRNDADRIARCAEKQATKRYNRLRQYRRCLEGQA